MSRINWLTLNPGASVKEITIAYRRLALKSHPGKSFPQPIQNEASTGTSRSSSLANIFADKNKSDIASATQKFQMISNAHDTLKDAHMRRRYDARLPQLKAAWTAEQFQHAQERAQQQKRQAAYARKSADLESKKAQISGVIQLQQQEVLRLRAQWDSLRMGVIPQGFEGKFHVIPRSPDRSFPSSPPHIRRHMCSLSLD